MRLRFSPRAHLQLRQIRDYIARDRPDAAELVRGRIFATITNLRALPRLGRSGQRAGTRELLVAGLPYLIVYRLDIGDADELVILGIFHAAQQRRGL